MSTSRKHLDFEAICLQTSWAFLYAGKREYLVGCITSLAWHFWESSLRIIYLLAYRDNDETNILLLNQSKRIGDGASRVTSNELYQCAVASLPSVGLTKGILILFLYEQQEHEEP